MVVLRNARQFFYNTLIRRELVTAGYSGYREESWALGTINQTVHLEPAVAPYVRVVSSDVV